VQKGKSAAQLPRNMADYEPPLNERTAAQQTLLAATRRVSGALPAFSTWLLGGLGAAFTLVVANIEKVSQFIEITHVRFGLILFLISLGVAVLATYLSTMVKVALGAQEDGEAISKQITASSTDFDVALFMSEYERGLLPPIRWIARSSMNKAEAGDIVAAARMIAKLSQVQALLVAGQSILALVAVAGLVCGLKMQ
jgi:hypothetical protein